MANLKKINIGGTSYDIVDAGGRELIKNINEVTIPALEEDIEEVGGKVTTLIGSDANMSAREIVQDEVAKQLESENISDSFDTLKEMAEYLSGHPNTVTEMNEAITKNADDIKTINDDLDVFMEGTVGESNGAGTIFAQLTSINSELESLGGGAGSIANQIKTEIEKLDAEVTSTGGTNVEVKVTEVDGKITAVAITKDESYKKPSTGIATNDLATGVVTSLGKADTAYQKPSTGIPATDLTAGLKDEISRLTAVTKGYTGDNAIGTAISEVNQAATQKAGQAETNAKAYADGLASNYATAAQGAKADASIRKIEIDGEAEDYISISDTATEGTKELLLAVMDVASTTAKGNLADAYDVKGYVDSAKSGLQNQINAIANGVDNNFSAVETRFGTNEANINKALTATKETFTYDAATETLTITSSAV